MAQKNFEKLLNLNGKTAIITGGAGIIGRRVCAATAANGANVIIAEIDLEADNALAGEINAKSGGKAISLECDVSNPESIASFVTASVNAFGSIHVLHNNVSGKSKDLGDFLAPFEEYKLETWRDAMSVSLDGMF